MVLSRDASKCWKRINAKGSKMETASQEQEGVGPLQAHRLVKDTDANQGSADGMTGSAKGSHI